MFMLGSLPDCLRVNMVRAEGVEPPHLAILEPKSSASTSSATRAALEGRAPITGLAGGATRQPLSRDGRSVRRGESRHATTAPVSRQSGRAPDDAVPCPARPAEPAAARNAAARPGRRRAGAAVAGNDAVARTDFARGLVSSLRAERSNPALNFSNEATKVRTKARRGSAHDPLRRSWLRANHFLDCRVAFGSSQ